MHIFNSFFESHPKLYTSADTDPLPNSTTIYTIYRFDRPSEAQAPPQYLTRGGLKVQPLTETTPLPEVVDWIHDFFRTFGFTTVTEVRSDEEVIFSYHDTGAPDDLDDSIQKLKNLLADYASHNKGWPESDDYLRLTALKADSFFHYLMNLCFRPKHPPTLHEFNIGIFATPNQLVKSDYSTEAQHEASLLSNQESDGSYQTVLDAATPQLFRIVSPMWGYWQKLGVTNEVQEPLRYGQ